MGSVVPPVPKLSCGYFQWLEGDNLPARDSAASSCSGAITCSPGKTTYFHSYIQWLGDISSPLNFILYSAMWVCWLLQYWLFLQELNHKALVLEDFQGRGHLGLGVYGHHTLELGWDTGLDSLGSTAIEPPKIIN